MGFYTATHLKKSIRSVRQRVIEEKKVIFEKQWGFSKIFTYGILLGTKLGNLHLVGKKRPLISDHIKGPLVAAFRSLLMKALDRSVETLGL